MASRQEKWDALPQVGGMQARARGLADLSANALLAEYLDAANLRIARLEDTESLRLRRTRFYDLSFARVSLPRAVVEWPRDQLSSTRSAIVVCLSGQLDATPASSVLQRRPGLFLVPPGLGTVSFETTSPLNEILYISAPASLVEGLDLVDRAPGERPEIPATILAPLLAFAATLSSGPSGDPIIDGPLRSAALEVASALARMIAEGDPSELTLFSRAQRLIVENHSDTRLTVSRLATATGVSQRSLQAAFASEGTTVAHELRAARTRTAEELRRRSPALPATQIARAAGFGSVSTLYRAMEAGR